MLKVPDRGGGSAGRQREVGKGQVGLSRFERLDGFVDQVGRDHQVDEVLILRLAEIEDLEGDGGAASDLDKRSFDALQLLVVAQSALPGDGLRVLGSWDRGLQVEGGLSVELHEAWMLRKELPFPNLCAIRLLA